MPAPRAPVERMRLDLPFPSQVDNRVLAGAAETVTKPAGVSFLQISVSAICYMRTGGDAAVPVADVADGSGSFPVHPGQDLFLNVKSIATFSIIGTAVVGLAWYADHGDL